MEKVLTDLDRVNIAKQEYELGSQLDTLVKIMSQDKVLPIGKVAHVQDGGKETGEQIYTITPNGTLDKPRKLRFYLRGQQHRLEEMIGKQTGLKMIFQ